MSERGLLPLYGMPTSSRDLYVGLEQEGPRQDYRAEWDTFGRDQELALFDFAPGSVRTREKEHYLCVGFTGSLPEPKPFLENPDRLVPFAHWLRESYVLGHCERCGIWTRRSSAPVVCTGCGDDLPADRSVDCITPAGYRTDFRPTGESLASSVGQRVVLASLGELDGDARGNLRINFGERSEVFVANAGSVVDGVPAGFQVEQVTDTEAARLTFMRATQLKLQDQGVSSAYLERTPFKGRFAGTADGNVTKGWLAARKVTNSIQVSPLTTNPRLRLSELDGGVFEMSRDPGRTAVRAAAISATELLVQRAAMELDVAPNELDVLPPYSAEDEDGRRRPFLQISDALSNGSGFCRHLLSGASLPIEALVASILDDATKWPREKTDQEVHRSRCATSCYACMQRFDNRNYHGLLDWRLGLSFLRSMRDPAHMCGLDGVWNSDHELSDWLSLAETCVSRAGTLVPGSESKRVGSLRLPAFSLDDRRSRWAVVVHPLWTREGLTEALDLDGAVVFIDTFELLRRPLQAIERARR